MSIHSPHFHLPIHAVIEVTHDVTEKLEKGVERVTHGTKAFKLMSGTVAFRHYDWLHNLPRVNVSGNFRGMVLSAKWKSAFLISSRAAEGLEKVEPLATKLNLYASLALNLAHAVPDFERVAKSQDDAAVKIGKFGALAASVSSKTLIGVVEGPSHAVLHGLSKAFSTAGMFFHNGAITNAGQLVDKADINVVNLADNVTNPKNIFKFFNPSLSW